jgi:hypothetical protein
MDIKLMIDYKYAFVINEMENNQYALVMTCWYVDEAGTRIDVKSQTEIYKSLTECFDLVQSFVIPE